MFVPSPRLRAIAATAGRRAGEILLILDDIPLERRKLPVTPRVHRLGEALLADMRRLLSRDRMARLYCPRGEEPLLPGELFALAIQADLALRQWSRRFGIGGADGGDEPDLVDKPAF